MCAALSLSIDAIRPLNRWDYDDIRPGPVGPVGEVLISQRLKSSLPGDFRWDKTYYGKNESLYGSSIADGSRVSFNSGGGPAKCVDSNWGGRRHFKTSHGWVYQDLRVPDKMVEPNMGSLPQYTWRNKLATVNRAKTTGFLFPIPAGGLIGQPRDGLTRGGSFPRITDVAGENDISPVVDSGESLSLPQRNFKPHLSSFGGPAALESKRMERMQNYKGAPGRIKSK